ncbi:MAG: hypothetical protein FWE22_03495 [Firmicutes bacterium]|nr:hypothetical protein [Bacillota bacterium]
MNKELFIKILIDERGCDEKFATETADEVESLYSPEEQEEAFAWLAKGRVSYVSATPSDLIEN